MTFSRGFFSGNLSQRCYGGRVKATNPYVSFWIFIYTALVLSPLAMVLAGPLKSTRGFLTEFGVALGYVGLTMMCLQFAITGRWRHLASQIGADKLLQFHYAAGVAAMVLVLAHPAMLFMADLEYLSYLDPRVNLPRAVALTLATVSTVLIVVLSVWRQKFKLIYEWWRVSHGALSLLVVLIGLVHILQVSHHTYKPWQQAYIIAFVGFSSLSLLHVRLVRPLLMKNKPYEVVEVHAHRGSATTLKIKPIGHAGMKFQAGQYAWMTVGSSPYSLQQHPFSFSSGETCGHIGFTAKPVGDFTSVWRGIKEGSRVWLEGPYGAFKLSAHRKHRGVVFYASGAGVTPIMSILRTLRDRGDDRACLLICANPTQREILFKSELDEMTRKLNLRVVHILSKPEPGWEGETGYIDEAFVERHLPESPREHDYFLCAATPVMNLVEHALLAHGVPHTQILSERFNIV